MHYGYVHDIDNCMPEMQGSIRDIALLMFTCFPLLPQENPLTSKCSIIPISYKTSEPLLLSQTSHEFLQGHLQGGYKLRPACLSGSRVCQGVGRLIIYCICIHTAQLLHLGFLFLCRFLHGSVLRLDSLKPNGQVDFSDPDSVQQLTKSLLKRDFGLRIVLPPDRLCPPVCSSLRSFFFLLLLLDPHAKGFCFTSHASISHVIT